MWRIASNLILAWTFAYSAIFLYALFLVKDEGQRSGLSLLLALPWSVVTFCVYDLNLEGGDDSPGAFWMSTCFICLNIAIFYALYRFAKRLQLKRMAGTDPTTSRIKE
jgi:hypothetical protein